MPNHPKVLLVAFHFPPFSGSSGIHRSLKFTKYLPDYGWQPIVLSATPNAYTDTSQQLMAEIPATTPVYRSLALDAQRHLSYRGRYPDFLAVPDRFSSWVLSGVPYGLYLIRKHKPRAIWSTYPLASAHLLAGALAKLSGLPWIADFRDPMTGKGASLGSLKEKSYAWIESKAIQQSTSNVFVTDFAMQSYAHRFSYTNPRKFRVIENGYDEEDFSFVGRTGDASSEPKAWDQERPITLLHTGGIYPDASPAHRGPGQLFRAVRALIDEGHPLAHRIQLKFRGAGLDSMVNQIASDEGLNDIVETLPSIDYHAALREMAQADGLVLLQGQNFSQQIPAKIYEYLRVGRPILGLCGKDSATAGLMRNADANYISSLASYEDIKHCLTCFLADLPKIPKRMPIPDLVSALSRKELTGQLGKLLDEITGR